MTAYTMSAHSKLTIRTWIMSLLRWVWIFVENRIKIKYVNAKNAVDYTCKRFNVINSKALTYHYEQYIEICKEREKFKQTNEDLEYMKNRLVRILRSMNLYDARIWLNYADAIVNKNEYRKLMDFVKKIDPKAFVTVYSVNEIRYQPKKL